MSEHLERAVAALALERLGNGPKCHCGVCATHMLREPMGYRDLCEEHAATAPKAEPRHDLATVTALTAFLHSYTPTK